MKVDLEAVERWADPATPAAWTQKMRDEAFVLHAREDVPALVAEVRALRARVANGLALAEEWERDGFDMEAGRLRDAMN